jgi:hypothetical protein
MSDRSGNPPGRYKSQGSTRRWTDPMVVSDHADTIRARLERCCGNNIYLTPKEGWDLLARCDALENALRDYAGHQAWRCEYRSRYGACQCGLDETLEKLGLPPVPVNDPESAPAPPAGERQET